MLQAVAHTIYCHAYLFLNIERTRLKCSHFETTISNYTQLNLVMCIDRCEHSLKAQRPGQVTVRLMKVTYKLCT